jgi:hypothetical protein
MKIVVIAAAMGARGIHAALALGIRKPDSRHR